MKDETFNAVILDRLKVAAQQSLPAYVAEHLTAQIVSSEMDRVVYQLRSEVLGLRVDSQKAHGSVIAEFYPPATWWQHFKQQYRAKWWCRWLATHRPVRTTTVRRIAYAAFDVERYRTFPDATIRPPRHLGQEVRLLIPQRMTWTWDDEAGR